MAYAWVVTTADIDTLEATLNALDVDGWEVFSVVASEASTSTSQDYAVVARRHGTAVEFKRGVVDDPAFEKWLSKIKARRRPSPE